MFTPLARDQHGNTFEVPSEAVYWRVRRHTGGRPSTVLGPDGEPLFIPIHGDKPDLVANGCTGSLRLEAVNADFRSLDAPVAFVELGSGADIARNASAADGNADLVRVGFESLTRTVEAMQRAQVERERANAIERKAFADAQIAAQRMNTELVIALAERIGGGKPQDALSAMKEHAAIQRVLEQGTQRNAGLLPAPTTIVAAEDSGLPKWLIGLLPVVPVVVDAVAKIVGAGRREEGGGDSPQRQSLCRGRWRSSRWRGSIGPIHHRARRRRTARGESW
jgi:hypothetical protein